MAEATPPRNAEDQIRIARAVQHIRVVEAVLGRGEHTAARIAPGGGLKLLQPVGGRCGVRIEQYEPLPARQICRLVVGHRKTDIVRILYEPGLCDTREIQRIWRSVGRCIVDDNQLKVLKRLGLQRIDGGLQIRAPIIVHNDHREADR